MKIACASCQTPLDAELAPSTLGAPLCDACSKAAPPPRQRPRVPEISFAPREGASPGEVARPEPAPDAARVSATATPASKGDRLSFGDFEAVSSGGPALLDGGFDPLSRHGDFTSDAEPVSLHDLGMVLGPMAAPPAWSGAIGARAAAPAAGVRVPSPGGVRIPSPGGAAGRLPVAAGRLPVAASRLPVSVAAEARAGRDGGSAKTPGAAAAARAADVARVPADAVPSKKVRPRFFDVDSIPPPSSKPARSLDRPRHSGHEDLRVLMASVPDRRASRPDDDLTALRGALFADAPPRAPALPGDLSLLLPEVPGVPGRDEGAPAPRAAPMAPVLDLDRVPRPLPPIAEAPQPEIELRRAIVVGGEDIPVAAAAVAVAPPPPRYAPRSGAPGPVVAERRPAATAAARRSGVANWVVGVASVSAVALVVVLRFAAAPTDPAVDGAARDRISVSPPRPPAATPAPAEPPSAVLAASPPLPVSTAAVPAVAAGGDGPRAASHRDTLSPATASPATVSPVGASPVALAASPVTARPVERAAAPAPTVAPAPAGGGDFSPAAARAALAAAAGAASACKQPTDPSGGGRVSVTFAPSGRAVSAQLVGGPFQGTRTGGCIAAAFRSATVPPFAGDPVVVSKEVSIR